MEEWFAKSSCDERDEGWPGAGVKQARGGSWGAVGHVQVQARPLPRSQAHLPGRTQQKAVRVQPLAKAHTCAARVPTRQSIFTPETSLVPLAS